MNSGMNAKSRHMSRRTNSSFRLPECSPGVRRFNSPLETRNWLGGETYDVG
jgi:hypothetical protein